MKTHKQTTYHYASSERRHENEIQLPILRTRSNQAQQTTILLKNVLKQIPLQKEKPQVRCMPKNDVRAALSGGKPPFALPMTILTSNGQNASHR